MKIGGTSDVNGPQRIPPRLGMEQVQPPVAQTPPVAGDRVEISGEARLSQALAGVPDIRVDKVAAARQAIAADQLDTPEHMDVALNRLLDEFVAE